MKKIFLFSIFLSTFFSCEKVLIKADPKNTNVNNFEMLWKVVDEKYSFFDYKKLDWDAIYKKYRPQVNENLSERELFKIMANMMNELKDGHTNLRSQFDVSRSLGWYRDYPQNFNETIIERNYLKDDFLRTGPFSNKWITSDIAYIRYSSFMGISDEEQINLLLKEYTNAKGIIIDIRDNTGGAVIMVDYIASHFMSNDMTLGYEKYKKGKKHDDFGDFIPYHIKKSKGVVFDGKVVILTNRLVYSAANWFASVMSELPNVTLMGDNTGGGGGAPISGELLNGWQYNFSGNQLLNLQKEQVENGVKTDIKIDLKKEDEFNGKDTILENAIKFLK